jgi:Restriction endonuclease
MSAPNNIRMLDIRYLDDLFEMGGGFVLDFVDRTFTQFFSELGINIDEARYQIDGTSKAKRLRCFLRTADKHNVSRALEALWEYRETTRARAGKPETIKNARNEFLALVARVKGDPAPPNADTAQKKTNSIDPAAHTLLRSDLIDLSALAPHPRGYAFEKFLKSLFDFYGLEARDAFRLKGEQIDGSFQLSNHTYLLEAKWQNPPCGAEPLHAFHGKVEQKASWARGLFVSNSGFTEEGLVAFGRGKSVVCMDGLDLYDILDRALALDEVLNKKARHAAETGASFARVRDLFPSSPK